MASATSAWRRGVDAQLAVHGCGVWCQASDFVLRRGWQVPGCRSRPRMAVGAGRADWYDRRRGVGRLRAGAGWRLHGGSPRPRRRCGSSGPVAAGRGDTGTVRVSRGPAWSPRRGTAGGCGERDRGSRGCAPRRCRWRLTSSAGRNSTRGGVGADLGMRQWPVQRRPDAGYPRQATGGPASSASRRLRAPLRPIRFMTAF